MAKTTSSFIGFSASIRSFIDEIPNQADEMQTLVAIDLRDEIHGAAPYDTGALKESITMSVGQPPTVFDGHVIDHSEVLASSDKSIYIATNLKYAEMVEYGLYPKAPKKPTGRTWNGFSTQAQSGFFRVSIINIGNRWGK